MLVGIIEVDCYDNGIGVFGSWMWLVFVLYGEGWIFFLGSGKKDKNVMNFRFGYYVLIFVYGVIDVYCIYNVV